jgi:rhodanese-related sulfurtransferase
MPLAGVDGAINVPVDALRDRLDELDPHRPTVVSCAVGIRAHVAARILRGHGFADVALLSGGSTLRQRAIAAAEAPREPSAS